MPNTYVIVHRLLLSIRVFAETTLQLDFVQLPCARISFFFVISHITASIITAHVDHGLFTAMRSLRIQDSVELAAVRDRTNRIHPLMHLPRERTNEKQ